MSASGSSSLLLCVSLEGLRGFLSFENTRPACLRGTINRRVLQGANFPTHGVINALGLWAAEETYQGNIVTGLR